MASITSRNSRKSRAIRAPIDSIESNDVSHAAAKLHARKMKPTSRVIPAREQYGDSTKEDHQLPSSQQLQQPKPKSFEDTRNKDYGDIKIATEMANVRDAVAEMAAMAQKQAKRTLVDDKTQDSQEAISHKDFKFQKGEGNLTPKAQKTVRRIIREELDATNFGRGGGLFGDGGPDANIEIDKDKKNRRGSRRNVPIPIPTSGVPTTEEKPGSKPTAQKAPSTGPIVAGDGKRTPKARRAYNRSERLGNIFGKTARSKGVLAATKKTIGLAAPKIGAGVAGAVGLLGVGLSVAAAKQSQNELDDLLEAKALTKEEHAQASRELWFRSTFGTVGAITLGVLAAPLMAAGPLGMLAAAGISSAGAYGGDALGGFLANKMPTMVGNKTTANSKNWEESQAKFESEQAVIQSENKKKYKIPDAPKVVRKNDTKSVSPDVAEGIKFASKELNIPLEEMVATAEIESGMRADPKNPNSSARGTFQHITKTWNSLVDLYPKFAEQYDIKKVSMFRDDRTDPKKSALMFGLLKQDDAKRLQGATTGDPKVDAYLTQLLGAGVGGNFIRAFTKNPYQLVSDVDGITQNEIDKQGDILKHADGRHKTLAEVVSGLKGKIARLGAVGMKKMAEHEEKKTATISSGAPTPANTEVSNPTSSVWSAYSERGSHKSPTKASETPTRIEQTDEATKAWLAKQQPPTASIIPIGIQQPAPQAPPQQSAPVGANLSTRNDNPYLTATRLQEMLRQK